MGRKTGSKNKKQSEPTERIQGDVPVTTALEFRAACARKGRTYSSVITELVKQWINQVEGAYGSVEQQQPTQVR